MEKAYYRPRKLSGTAYSASSAIAKPSHIAKAVTLIATRIGTLSITQLYLASMVILLDLIQ